MHKITADIQNAIRTNTRFKGANTEITVRTREDGQVITSVFFHGHLIAQNGATGWGFCFCGYRTNTTRDRINAVRGALGLPLVSLTQFRDAGALLTWFE